MLLPIQSTIMSKFYQFVMLFLPISDQFHFYYVYICLNTWQKWLYSIPIYASNIVVRIDKYKWINQIMWELTKWRKTIVLHMTQLKVRCWSFFIMLIYQFSRFIYHHTAWWYAILLPSTRNLKINIFFSIPLA